MKKSWKPQHRCSIFLNPLIYAILTIVSIPISLILAMVFQTPLFLFVIVLFGGFWWGSFKFLDIYKDYGYSKLTIDRLSRVLIFDDIDRIPFTSIVDVKFKIEEIRDYDYNNSQFLIGRSRNVLTSFCSSMHVFTNDGRSIKFYIDYRHSVKEILNMIRACGLKVSASEDFEANASGLVAVVFTVIPFIIWVILKFLFSGN